MGVWCCLLCEGVEEGVVRMWCCEVHGRIGPVRSVRARKVEED